MSGSTVDSTAFAGIRYGPEMEVNVYNVYLVGTIARFGTIATY